MPQSKNTHRKKVFESAVPNKRNPLGTRVSGSGRATDILAMATTIKGDNQTETNAVRT